MTTLTKVAETAVPTDGSQFWSDSLHGKAVIIHADDPQPGYYKMRAGRDAPWLPVLIRQQFGQLVCRVANEKRDPLEIWPWCAEHAVDMDAARQAFATGAWPGDVGVGHNSGDLSLADEIADASATAIDWLKASGISDTITMDIAANHKARLLELRQKAEAERKSKKQPYLDGGRQIDAEYSPLVDSADAAYKSMQAALTKYMSDEDAKARKAAFEAARIENEKRIADYHAAETAAASERDRIFALAIEHNMPIESVTMIEPELPEILEFVVAEPVRIQAGGQRGKKTTLRESERYKISDYAAALAHCKDHADVVAAVEKVAFAQCRAGAIVPGVTSYIEKLAV